MIIIETATGKHWTEKYGENNGFVEFQTKTKAGKTFNVSLNKSQIISITDIGEIDEK